MTPEQIKILEGLARRDSHLAQWSPTAVEAVGSLLAEVGQMRMDQNRLVLGIVFLWEQLKQRGWTVDHLDAALDVTTLPSTEEAERMFAELRAAFAIGQPRPGV
jgi:hypothetical protein